MHTQSIPFRISLLAIACITQLQGADKSRMTTQPKSDAIKIYAMTVELKQPVDSSNLNLGDLPSDIGTQVFEHSDAKTRLKYRRLNNKWKNAIELGAKGYVESTFDTTDQRAWHEFHKPKKLVFTNPKVETLTSLMRQGFMQFAGTFSFAQVNNNNTGVQHLTECLKSQEAIDFYNSTDAKKINLAGSLLSLRNNPRLKKVTLINNDLGPDGKAALITLVNANGNIQNLTITTTCVHPKTNVRTESFGMNDIEKLLKINHSLHTLCLSNSTIKDTDVPSLQNGLKDNKSLYNIHIGARSNTTPEIQTELTKDPRITFDAPRPSNS